MIAMCLQGMMAVSVRTLLLEISDAQSRYGEGIWGHIFQVNYGDHHVHKVDSGKSIWIMCVLKHEISPYLTILGVNVHVTTCMPLHLVTARFIFSAL